MAYILLPDGRKIAVTDNTSTEAVQHMRIMRSDDPDSPVLADGNGLRVQLGAALPGGDANIGNIDVLTVPADPFGANADAAATGAGSINAHLRQLAGVGINVLSSVPGTGATALGKAVDSPVGATDTGVAALAQRVDTPATITPAANDYTQLIVDALGRLWGHMVVDDGSGNAANFEGFRTVTATPTLDTSAYAVLDSLHTTPLTLAGVVRANGGTGHLIGATLTSRHNSFAGQILAYWFGKSPTGTTANSPLSISDTDMEECFGVSLFDFAGSNGGVSRVAEAGGRLPKPFKCDAGTDDIYAILQVWTTTPTFGPSDLKLAVHVQPDS